MKPTAATKEKQVKREWHLVDVKGNILGRSATKIANLLMGKQKPYFVKSMDCGDFVVVINAKDVKVTGGKETKKVYTRYSGYPGGLKKETLGDLKERRPDQIIVRAVSGMLPKNRLHDRMLARLYVFPGEEHKYADKFGDK